MAFVAFGDSITHGYPVQPGQIWAKIAADYAGKALENKAVGSSQAADQAYVASQLTLSPNDSFGIFLGVNDLTYYGDNAVKRQAYINHLRALIVNCSCPLRVKGQDMGKSGAWSAFAPTGSLTNEVGAKATASVAGKAAYAVFRNQNNGTVTDGALSEIRSDGDLKGTRAGNGAQVGNTYLGRDYAPQAFRISGLAAGPHSLEVRHASSGKYTLLEYVAGSEQSANPHIYVLNIPMRAHDLPYRGDYNADLAAMVSELSADGRNVHLVDIASLIGPEHLDPDEVHINATGHALIASAVMEAMSVELKTVSYPCLKGGSLTIKLNSLGQAADFFWK